MSCYTISLASGSTILALAIKVGTIERYLFVARKLSTAAGVMDPTLDIRGKRTDIIKAILDEAKRWQTVPNSREPLAWEMVHWGSKRQPKRSLQANRTISIPSYITGSLWLCKPVSERVNGHKIVAFSKAQRMWPKMWMVQPKHSFSLTSPSKVPKRDQLLGSHPLALPRGYSRHHLALSKKQ